MTYESTQSAPPYNNAPAGGVTKNRGCSGSMGCLLALSLVLNVIVLGGALLFAEKPGPRSKMKEIWVSGKGKQKLALVHVRGPIMEGTRSTATMTAASDIVSQLNRAKRDNNVKGTLIMANSPGGGVTASDKIYQAVKAHSKIKPVVVLMEDVCASGCVYMSANATTIVAHPTTVTGSIGVITSSINVHKMFEKIGIQGITIASKENKAILSPYEPVKPEHKAIIKKIIDEMYVRFVDIMAAGRKIPKAEMLKIADGRVFTATTAKTMKLVDELGYKADAWRILMKKTGVTAPRIVKYRQQVGLAEILLGYAQLPHEIKNSRQLSIEKIMGLQAPRMFYMYK